MALSKTICLEDYAYVEIAHKYVNNPLPFEGILSWQSEAGIMPHDDGPTVITIHILQWYTSY